MNDKNKDENECWNDLERKRKKEVSTTFSLFFFLDEGLHWFMQTTGERDREIDRIEEGKMKQIFIIHLFCIFYQKSDSYKHLTCAMQISWLRWFISYSAIFKNWKYNS